MTTAETTAELKARIETLEAEAAARNKPRALSIKVAKSGGASLYGLQRFPVTLYKEQWRRVLDHADQIRAFLAEHDSELATKNG